MRHEILKNGRGNLNRLVIFLIIMFIYLGSFLYKDVSPHPTLLSMFMMIVILFILILILNKKKIIPKGWIQKHIDDYFKNE